MGSSPSICFVYIKNFKNLRSVAAAFFVLLASLGCFGNTCNFVVCFQTNHAAFGPQISPDYQLIYETAEISFPEIRTTSSFLLHSVLFNSTMDGASIVALLVEVRTKIEAKLIAAAAAADGENIEDMKKIGQELREIWAQFIDDASPFMQDKEELDEWNRWFEAVVNTYMADIENLDD